MHVRKAILPDASAIHGLIFEYARHGTLLPRSLPEIYENIRDFTVVESKGRIAGCGALHIYGMHLAELRSIAVWPLYKGRGAGRVLIEGLLDEARQQRVACVCLFTRIPSFFGHLGFRKVKMELLPDKVYKDCRNCGKRKDCDEVAMIRGRLPTFDSHEEARRKARRGAKEQKNEYQRSGRTGLSAQRFPLRGGHGRHKSQRQARPGHGGSSRRRGGRGHVHPQPHGGRPGTGGARAS